MKLNKLFLLLLPLSLVACNNKQKDPVKPDPSLLTTPLCMTCTSDKGVGIVNVMHATYDTEDNLSLQYSKDNKKWHDVEFTNKQKAFVLSKDETVYFRGNNPDGLNFYDEENGTPRTLTMFAATGGYVNLGGNVMSLLSATHFAQLKEIPNNFCFANLFCNLEATSIYSDASQLSLPATKLKKGCYYQMFNKNQILTKAPKLLATDLVERCYEEMFSECLALEQVEVAFDETAFTIDGTGKYLYTNNWFDDAATSTIITHTFIWPGTIGSIERNESTIPNGWVIKTPEEVF